MNLDRFMTILLVCACFARALIAAGAAHAPALDEYHGTKVADEYRWLENARDPEVRAWSADQNKRARAYLDSLPMRAEIEDRLSRLLTNSAPDYFSLTARKGSLFLL